MKVNCQGTIMTTKFCSAFLIVLALAKIAFAQQPAAALLEKAKLEQRLVVYGDTNLRDLQILAEGFRAKFSFIKQVETLSLPIDRLFAKISTEFQAGVYHPDVITMSAGQTVQAKQAGWLAQYVSPEAQAYGKGFIDAEGFWHSNYMNTKVITFNSRLMPNEAAPKNYQDLLHPRW